MVAHSKKITKMSSAGQINNNLNFKKLTEDFKSALGRIDFPPWMRGHPKGCSFTLFYDEALAKEYSSLAEIKKVCTWLMRNMVPCECKQILNFNKNTYWKLRKQWRQLLRKFIIDETNSELTQNNQTD